MRPPSGATTQSMARRSSSAKSSISVIGVEQDHRAVKRVMRPILGFKSFDAAQDALAGIELMHMIRKRQLVVEEEKDGLTAVEQFYILAA